jgi:hypothetical protein
MPMKKLLSKPKKTRLLSLSKRRNKLINPMKFTRKAAAL